MKNKTTPFDQAHQQLLAKSFLFRECFQDGSGDQLAALAEIRQAERGTIFFRKGDPGELMFAILSGAVRIGTTSENGREMALGILGPGEFFGEISLLDGERRTAEAIALEPCSLLVLKRQDFLSYLQSSPAFAAGLLRGLAKRLRMTDTQIEDNAFLNLPARLAKRLLLLARDHGQAISEGSRINMRLSQQVLANLVGSSRESVNRVIGGWEDSGILLRDKGYIVIADPQRLAQATVE